MKKITIAVFCLLLATAIFAKDSLQTIYSLKLEIYRDGKAVLHEINTMQGTPSTFPTTETGYSVKILDSKNKIIFEKEIGVSFMIYSNPPIDAQLDSTTVHLRVPYFEDAKRIRIYKLGEVLLDIDLSEKVCNSNSICETGENKNNCPEDCKTEKKISLVLILIMTLVLTILTILILKRI